MAALTISDKRAALNDAPDLGFSIAPFHAMPLELILDAPRQKVTGAYRFYRLALSRDDVSRLRAFIERQDHETPGWDKAPLIHHRQIPTPVKMPAPRVSRKPKLKYAKRKILAHR